MNKNLLLVNSIMVDEREVESFYDDMATVYSEKHLKRFADDVLEHFVSRHLPKKKMRILDAGGGIGRFSVPLSLKGNEVTLTDISEKMIEEARKLAAGKKAKMRFFKESVTDMKNQKNSYYDAVLVINAILDYCGDHMKALEEIKRVLKPGGTLLGSVNNRFMYASTHELNQGDFKTFEKTMKTGERFITWGDSEKGHYTHEFTHEELVKSLEKAGFKDIKVLGVFNLLGKYTKPEWLKNPIKRKKYLELQIEYAEKKEYLNNSGDYFFSCKKK